MQSNYPHTRRNFLKGAAASLAFPTIISSTALGKGDKPVPSERITLGVVGFGARAQQVMLEFFKQPDSQFLAVCDVHDYHYRDLEPNMRKPLGWKAGKEMVDTKYGNTDCKAYTDAWEIFNRDDIDAVLVMTPDHWHAQHTLAALKAGKDVYCEKPITHFFAEGLAVHEEVARQNAIFQVGSQQRSSSNFHQAAELIRNGVIGKVTKVEVGLPAGPAEPLGETTITDPPKGLDYETWCGPSPKLPFRRAYHHRNWRFNLAYGGGNPMDWIGHHNDIAHWGMGFELSGPLSVKSTGWTYPKNMEIYNSPVEYTMECVYPGNVEWIISSKNRKGTKWIGEDGWVYVDRGELEASNPAWLEKDFKAGDRTAYKSPGHQRNFLDGVKTREECICPAEQGHRSITPGHIGYVSHALNREIKWDAAKQMVVDDQEAQDLLMQTPYRGDWELPARA